MFIKVINYLAPNVTTDDFRIRIRGPLANYIYGCQLTPVSRGALGYVSYQRGIIQGHLVHRNASRRAPVLWPRIVVRTVLSLDVSTQAVFLYHISVRYTFRVYLWCIGVHVTHWLLRQTDEINTIFQRFIGYIYIIAQMNSSIIVDICWLIRTFKYQCCGFQVHFKSKLVYNLKTKNAIFDQNVHIIY